MIVQQSGQLGVPDLTDRRVGWKSSDSAY